MKLSEYMKINEMKEWQNSVNDYYLTIDRKKLSNNGLKELLNKFIYNIPKKYSNKKEILAGLRKDGERISPKEFNSYIDGLDESRLEELMGKIYDAVDDWGHLR